MTEEKTAYGEGLFTTKEKKRGKKKNVCTQKEGSPFCKRDKKMAFENKKHQE